MVQCRYGVWGLKIVVYVLGEVDKDRARGSSVITKCNFCIYKSKDYLGGAGASMGT